MTKIGMVASRTANFVANTTRYITLDSGAYLQTTVEASYQRPQRTAGTYSNLCVRILNNSVTATSTIRLRKNGLDGNQVVTVGSGATGWFEDTTNTDAVSSGDLINLSLVTGATGTSLDISQIGAAFETPTGAVQVHSMAQAAFATAASSTYFLRYNGGGSLETTESAQCQFKSKIAGVVRNLMTSVTTNARSTNTVVGVRKNGSDTSLVITVAGGATGIFEDTAHTASVAPGDLLGRYLTMGSGSGNWNARYTNEFFSAAGATQEIASNTAVIGASLTRYGSISGGTVAAVTSELETQRAVPDSCSASSGEAYVSANTSAATTTFTLRKNGSDTAITFTAAAAATGWFEDTTNNVSFTSSDQIGWKTTTGAGGNVTVEHLGIKLQFEAPDHNFRAQIATRFRTSTPITRP